MRRRRSKRHLKKYLRSREDTLNDLLHSFLDNFATQQPLDSETNSRLLLRLRWLLYEFIYVRMKLNAKWMKRHWFLELLDVDQVVINSGEIKIVGDIVWWAEGKDAVGEWWFPDNKPHPTGVYKVKIRGDLSGGYWVLEPVIAKISRPKPSKHNAVYEIEFGKGQSYMKIKSK